MKYKFLTSLFMACFILYTNTVLTQETTITRVDPPCWWTNMKLPDVQLTVYGKNLTDVEISFNTKDIVITKIQRVDNKNYLFIDIQISEKAKPGKYTIDWKDKKGNKGSFPYELFNRGNTGKKGFSSKDVIYLLMPDRFSNGNPENDTKPGMDEKADRNNPNGRHGGDIKGIVKHLDYIADMGFTCIWINPLLENNNPAYSYHGYAITDFYKTDARFGSNSDYKALVDSAHKKGLKVIMDMVFNHSGTENYFIKDLPMSDWVNQWTEFTRSNYRGEVNTDPYASVYDKTKMANGWFDKTMADLNQKNPFVYNYLLQNSIWWIEYAGIDGIRMDTYPYPDKNAMSDWAKTILSLYPEFSIVGETWLREPSHTAYWLANNTNYDGYNSYLSSVTDFPTYFALKDAMNEKDGWIEGLSRFYYTLSQDYLYSDPNKLLIFPDNHDLTRFYTDINENFNRFKMAMAYILTTRGIPQIYYGTEILMTGKESDGHGFIRKDFPGGWDSDTVNAFSATGLSIDQTEAQQYLKKLINWRMTSSAVHEGNLKHFIPENGTYVFFRIDDSQAVMVILNKNSELIQLNSDRYNEVLASYKTGKNIITDEIVTDLKNIEIPAETALILELRKN